MVSTPTTVCPLPNLPPGEVLTSEQWTVLLSILDTFVPSIVDPRNLTDDSLHRVNVSEYDECIKSIQSILPASVDPSLASQYLAEAAVTDEFKLAIERSFAYHVAADQLKGMRMILSSLNTKVGSLLMTGSMTPFPDQSPASREQVLKSWSQSYVPTLRSLFKSFLLMALQNWVALSPSFSQVIGMPDVPVHGERGQDYAYEFLEFPPSQPSTIEADVVIVGSGCGAGILGKRLSEAGLSVIVAEKGRHFSSTHFPMTKGHGPMHLMENGGVMISDDTATGFLAGATFGGGGTVNWSACLQTQQFVRQEWADQGLPFFTSPEFQDCLDTVCGDIGASTEGIRHNFANRVLLEGSRRLGYAVKDVPQNTNGKEHYCGSCTFGCMGATKNGPAVALFPAAAKAGAKFIQRFNVREVVFEEREGKKRASGVVGIWTANDGETTQEVRVNAKRVVVCGGTMNSPLVLMRSGITNPLVGQNLHVHPATFVCAKFDEVVNPWEGGILTAVNTSLDNLDGKGHGCKIECTVGLPSITGIYIPWNTNHSPNLTSPALALKTRLSQFRHFIGFVVFARDRDSGSVYPDPVDGRLRIKYTTSAFDTAHVLEGLIAGAKVAYAAGAREVFTLHPEMEPFKRPVEDSSGFPDVNEPAFQAWLDKVRKLGIRSPDPCILGSAHQMGTCRMGKSAAEGVVDGRGRVFGFEDEAKGSLYVADASVLPSASGVNPMVSTMAVAEKVAREIIKEERGLEKGI